MGRGCSNDQQASRTAGRKAAAAREDAMSRESRLEQAGPWQMYSPLLLFIGIRFDIRLRVLLHNVPST